MRRVLSATPHSSDGVEGSSNGYNKSGVYAHQEGENFGYGVYAVSNVGRGVYASTAVPEPDDSYAVYAEWGYCDN